MLQAALHGILLALGLILPLGVQNVFVFNQGTTHAHFSRVLPAVVTASLCDTLLILIAVQGVSIVVLNFVWFKSSLLIAGLLFLLYMGWLTWNNSPHAQTEPAPEKFSAKKQIVFAMSVSLLNPHAILDTIGVIGTSSLAYSGLEKWAFTLSTILVSWLWFTGLAMVGRFTGKLDRTGNIIRTLNKTSAVFMWIAAMYIGFSLV